MVVPISLTALLECFEVSGVCDSSRNDVRLNKPTRPLLVTEVAQRSDDLLPYL